MKSGSKDHYPTMPLEDIMEMPVHRITDPKGSILFLWITTPLLPDGIEVMKSWGFGHYITSLYWDKQNYGMGYWWRGRVEQCLVGMRGHVKAYRCQKVNLIQSKAREHSRKPDEFWELAEPHAEEPRLELFCRGTPRYGWHGWGIDCARGEPIPELDDYMRWLESVEIMEEGERAIQEEDAQQYKGWDVDHI